MSLNESIQNARVLVMAYYLGRQYLGNDITKIAEFHDGDIKLTITKDDFELNVNKMLGEDNIEVIKRSCEDLKDFVYIETGCVIKAKLIVDGETYPGYVRFSDEEVNPLHARTLAMMSVSLIIQLIKTLVIDTLSNGESTKNSVGTVVGGVIVHITINDKEEGDEYEKIDMTILLNKSLRSVEKGLTDDLSELNENKDFLNIKWEYNE